MEDAWLILLQPQSELVTREVIGHSETEGLEIVQIPLDGTNYCRSSMISLIHLEYQWIEIQCITLSFSPMLNLTTDTNIGCLQLSQQR